MARIPRKVEVPSTLGFMYSADADGRGRTRTFYFYLKKKKIIGIHISTGPIGASDRLGHPPPPISKLYEHYAQIPGWLSTRTGNLQFH